MLDQLPRRETHRVIARTGRLGRLGRGVGIVVPVLLASLGSCCSSARDPVGGAPFELPAGESLVWVSPSRCLAPCTYLPVDLVEVDLVGRPQPGSGRKVRAIARPAIEALIAAARAAGHPMTIVSAFRTFEAQVDLWNAMIDEPGRAALPGHSEHQLGTTVDLDTISPAGERWLLDRAPELGFVLSYTDGHQRLTGFREEPWHVRFVGRSLARQLASSQQTLEEYFRSHPGLSPMPGSCTDCPSSLARRPCDEVGEAGLCKGNVLTWCYEGTLAAVDCATSLKRCGVQAGRADCR